MTVCAVVMGLLAAGCSGRTAAPKSVGGAVAVTTRTGAASPTMALDPGYPLTSDRVTGWHPRGRIYATDVTITDGGRPRVRERHQVVFDGRAISSRPADGAFSPAGQPDGGAPGENRTPDALLRTEALYPLSYGGGANNRTLVTTRLQDPTGGLRPAVLGWGRSRAWLKVRPQGRCQMRDGRGRRRPASSASWAAR